MPKHKPDEVIVHRIELQETERRVLEQLASAEAFNRVATPVVSLMKDVTGMIVLMTIIAATGLTGVAFAFVASGASIDDVLDQFLTQRQQALLDAGIDAAEGVVAWWDFSLWGRLMAGQSPGEAVAGGVSDTADIIANQLLDGETGVPSQTTLTSFILSLIMGTLPGPANSGSSGIAE